MKSNTILLPSILKKLGMVDKRNVPGYDNLDEADDNGEMRDVMSFNRYKKQDKEKCS